MNYTKQWIPSLFYVTEKKDKSMVLLTFHLKSDTSVEPNSIDFSSVLVFQAMKLLF